MQAIILAGGFGTRLAPLVSGVPKAMAPVSGKPFLHWLLDYMQGQGVTSAALCVHYLHEHIRWYFGDRFGEIDLHYNVEDVPLGTGGALRGALALMDAEKPVLALNGDSMVRLDYRRMMAFHKREGRAMTMAIADMDDCSRYGALNVCKGRVGAFAQKGGASRGLINSGVYVLSPDLFDTYALPESFSFESDFLSPHAPMLQPAAYDGVESFIDIGIPDDFKRAQQEIPGFFGLAAA